MDAQTNEIVNEINSSNRGLIAFIEHGSIIIKPINGGNAYRGEDARSVIFKTDDGEVIAVIETPQLK